MTAKKTRQLPMKYKREKNWLRSLPRELLPVNEMMIPFLTKLILSRCQYLAILTWCLVNTFFVVWRSQRLCVIIQYCQNTDLFHTSIVMQFSVGRQYTMSSNVPQTFSNPFDNNFTIFPLKQQLKRDQEVLLAPSRPHTRTRCQGNKISLFFLGPPQSLIVY